jgi:hypothetical protein
MKMYIAVLDTFPDYMTPTLVAHAVLGAHIEFEDNPDYQEWLQNHFKKCVVRVNAKEFEKIRRLENVYLAHETRTLKDVKTCAVVCPRKENPNVLNFAHLWAPLDKT